MEISDIRVRLVKDANERLKAVCSITFDGEFVVRDVKIVEGTHGLFVAMPSRKLSVPCGKCRAQNHLRAKFCNECGAKLAPPRIPADVKGREKAHRDIAHPITASFRQEMQERVLEAYRSECERDQTAGYEPSGVEGDYERGIGEDDEYDALMSGVDTRRGAARGADEERGGGDRAASGGAGRPRRRRRRRRSGRPYEHARKTEEHADTAERTVSTVPERDSVLSERIEAFGSDTSTREEEATREEPFSVPVDKSEEEKPPGAQAGGETGPTEGTSRRAGQDEAAGKHPFSVEDDEDDTAFGAGIL